MRRSILLGAAMALGFVPLAMAESQTVEPHTQQSTTVDGATRAYDRTTAEHKGDKVTSTGLIRASQMMDHAVYNTKNEQIASVYDVVLDTSTGKVKYVAISTGGFMGLGDKLFAVPYDALQPKTIDGAEVCVLDVNEETLKNAQGFDQDNWPDMADRRWQEVNDRTYKRTAHPTR